MTIPELIEAVKEEKLSKEQLEGYQTQISYLFQKMQVELAEIEKEKALFFDKEGKPQEYQDPILPHPSTFVKSDISIKRMWQATQKGLREIELKRYSVALKELLNSLKSRIYQLIY